MTAPVSGLPVYYRAPEVARMLRCSPWWVKEQARRGRIPYSWIGGAYLFTAEHVAEIVRLFEVQPTDRSDHASGRPAPRRPAATETNSAVVQLRARTPRRVRAAAESAA